MQQLEAIIAQTNGTLTEKQWSVVRAALQRIDGGVEGLANIGVEDLRAVCPPGAIQILRRVRLQVQGKAAGKRAADCPLTEREIRDVAFCDDEPLQSAVKNVLLRRKIYYKHINALRRLCARFASHAAFMSMDHGTFAGLREVSGSRLGLGILRDTYLAQGGRREVVELPADAAALVETQVVLADWPRRLTTWLSSNLTEPGEMEHVLAFLQPIDERLRQQFPLRDASSSRKSLSDMALVLFNVLRDMSSTTSIREAMPFDMDNAALRTFLARLLLAWLGRTSCRKRSTLRVCESRMAKCLVNLVKTATRCGVFPNVVIRPATFAIRDLYDAMQGLVGAAELSALEDGTDVQQRRSHVPNDDTVARLKAVAERDPADQLLLAVLSTTGLRLRAITRLTVQHLWDAEGQQPAAAFHATEKNSERRVIVPCRELQEAIRSYMASPHAQHCVYVFAAKHRTTRAPTKHVLARRLQRICQEASIDFINPHAFRAYLITMLRERGLPTDVACKFVGHKCQQTQDTH